MYSVPLESVTVQVYVISFRLSLTGSKCKFSDAVNATNSTLCPAGFSHSMVVVMFPGKSVEHVSVAVWPTASTPGLVILTAAEKMTVYILCVYIMILSLYTYALM